VECLKKFVLFLGENGHLRKLGVTRNEMELLAGETSTVNNLRRQQGKGNLQLLCID